MKRKFTLILVLALTLLGLTSAVATTCVRDWDCGAGLFCDENNATSYGFAQCTTPPTTACNGTSINCTYPVDTPCRHIGTGQCSQSNICIASSAIGDPCTLDADCGTGNTCIYHTCTSGSTDVSCTSDSQCEAFKTCGAASGSTGFCRSQANLGGQCRSSSDCYSSAATILSTLVCENNICVGCPSDGGYEGNSPTYPSYADWFETSIGSGYYCNITHQTKCDLTNFWPTYSETVSQIAPEILPKRGENDPCASSACCANNMDCVNGHCVGAGGGINAPLTELQRMMCSGNYSNSLATYFLDTDTIPATWNYINVTPLRDLLNISDLYGIRSTYSGVSTIYNWWIKEKTPSYDPTMIAYLYSNSTGDLCYIHQRASTAILKCFDACLAPGLAYNLSSSGARRNTICLGNANCLNSNLPDIHCHDDEMFIGSVKTSATYNRFGINAVKYFTSTSTTIDSAFEMGGWSLGLYQRLGGVWTSKMTTIPEGYSAGTWAYKPLSFTAYLDKTTVGNLGLEPVLERTAPTYLTAVGTGLLSYLTGIELEDVFCCTNDTDCVAQYGDGWKCNTDTSVCYISAGGAKTATLIPYSSDGQFSSGIFCPSVNALFSVSIWGTIPVPGLPSIPNTPIHPTGTITVSVTGTGTATPSSCNAEANPCNFNYHSGTSGTDYINIDYSGNAEYGATSIRLKTTIQTACKWVKVLVYGKDTQVTIPYVSIHVLTNKPQTVTTDLMGYYSFGGLYPNIDLNLTLTKTGYDSISYSLDNATDFNKQVSLYMYPKTNVTNQPSNALLTTPPTDVGEVTNGFLKIAFAFFAWPFTWILLIMTFLLGLIVVRHLLLGAMG